MYRRAWTGDRYCYGKISLGDSDPALFLYIRRTDASDADEIEMQESEIAPEELSEELSEGDVFSAGDSEAEIEEVSIVSEPNKKEYDYGTVKCAC